MKTHLYIVALLPALLLTACDTTDPGAYEATYVVESYLVAGQRLQPVYLSRTAPLNQAYTFEDHAVSEAEVLLHRLADDGNVEATYAFREDHFVPGLYTPRDEAARAEPLHTYQLDVRIPATDDRITATTVVPDTFSLVEATLNEVVYQSTEQLELTVTRSQSPGRDQNYYIFVTEAFDPRFEQLTPFAKALFLDQDGDLTLEDLSIGGSPILNEKNYDLNPDGTLTIRLPWLAITFYGPNRLIANALDDNLYDFIRSQSVQQGGSTFSPGEIPNPLERVNGAHGVFGSYATLSFNLVVRPNEAGL